MNPIFTPLKPVQTPSSEYKILCNERKTPASSAHIPTHLNKTYRKLKAGARAFLSAVSFRAKQESSRSLSQLLEISARIYQYRKI